MGGRNNTWTHALILKSLFTLCSWWCFVQSDYERAVDLYTEVLSKTDSDVKALSGRANAYIKLKDDVRAMADVQQAIKLQPENSLLQVQLSQVRCILCPRTSFRLKLVHSVQSRSGLLLRWQTFLFKSIYEGKCTILPSAWSLLVRRSSRSVQLR